MHKNSWIAWFPFPPAFMKETQTKAALLFKELKIAHKGNHASHYIALQQARQDSWPQVKLGKTFNLRLFGV